MSKEPLVVLGVIAGIFLIAATVLGLNQLLLRHPIAKRLPFAPVLPLVLLLLYLPFFILLWGVEQATMLEKFLYPLLFPALVLFGCVVFITIPKLLYRARRWVWMNWRW